MLRLLILIMPSLICAGTAPALFAADPSPADIDHALHQSQDAVEYAGQVRQSEAFKQQFQEERDRAASATRATSETGSETEPDFPDLDAARQSKIQQDIRALLAHPPSPSITQPDHLHSEPPPLIFISFSIPKDDLRGLLREAAKTGSPVVLRGMMENSMKRTVERLGALLGKDTASNTEVSPALAIDPTLFERFKIDKVPAFVLSIDAVDPCTPAGCPTPDHLKLAGDVSLSYALDVMARESKESVLAQRAADWKRKLDATP